MELVHAGLPDRAIAEQLSVSRQTVSLHRRNGGVVREGAVCRSEQIKAGMAAMSAFAVEQLFRSLLERADERWKALLAGRTFDSEEPGDGGTFRLPRPATTTGLGASSANLLLTR